MNLVCLFRLHWMFDHAIGYNEDRTKWRCKACDRELGPTDEARMTEDFTFPRNIDIIPPTLVNRFDE